MWGAVLVVCVSVSVSGVLFSVGVCVCDLSIFWHLSVHTRLFTPLRCAFQSPLKLNFVMECAAFCSHTQVFTPACSHLINRATVLVSVFGVCVCVFVLVCLWLSFCRACVCVWPVSLWTHLRCAFQSPLKLHFVMEFCSHTYVFTPKCSHPLVHTPQVRLPVPSQAALCHGVRSWRNALQPPAPAGNVLRKDGKILHGWGSPWARAPPW